MPVTYTPGLKVSPSAVIRKQRRLPTRGEVLVRIGDQVAAEEVVAQAEMAGNLQTLRVAQMLQIEPHELESHLLKNPGDSVKPGDVIAQTQGLWGLFRSEVRSPVGGRIEEVSAASGYIRIRERPRRIEVSAHISGRVVEVIPNEGAVIEARGALVQGIFGVGGERRGILRVATESPNQALQTEKIGDCEGCVLIAGSGIESDAIAKAAESGAVGLIVGAIGDEALRSYVGYDIGVAITGQENVPMTLIVTEGFGELPMAQLTWSLLNSLQGELAAIDGATQIRAGVIRPEIIVTHSKQEEAVERAPEHVLAVGARARVIREPHFGALGQVTSLPVELTEIETESRVRIALVRLDSGEVIQVPRANLELIQE